MTKINDPDKLDLAYSLALGISTAGALGSFALTLQAGRNNSSVFLNDLFSLWVLSPLVVLIFAGLLTRKSYPRVRIAIYILMVIIPSASLFIYGELWSFINVKIALVFLMTPLVSWIVILAFYRRVRYRRFH